ncbi:P-loop containing nucleoside triphosphate hydrolase protein [Aspergillus fruticulosus]
MIRQDCIENGTHKEGTRGHCRQLYLVHAEYDFGLLLSAACGGGNPTQAVFFAKCITALSLPLSESSEIWRQVNFWLLMYVMLPFVQLLTLISQDIAFFNKHSSGVLTYFLSTETSHLAVLSGITLMTILLLVITLVAACAISLAVGWKLSLLVGASVWPFRTDLRRRRRPTKTIRTVASLTRDVDVCNYYYEQLLLQGHKLVWSVLKFQFFLCFSAVIFGTQSAGTIFNFAPDIAKARYAAASLKALFDWTPDIDSWSHDGETVQSIEGHVEFRNVHFRYPMRPNQLILRGLNLHVKPGQYVAFVGASGCGKSTAIALLERFYNPVLRGVYVDGQEISSLNINNYRSHLALVSQEPTLYQGTNRENIMLGTDRDDVSEDEMVLYCKNANIYDFIISLPDGFNTLIGSKGSMLPALLCNPRILLLDEATSALDSESEKLVQATLDTAAQGRTTIAVAHRLSTVQKADMIYVFNQGCSIECETHSELMQKRSAYFELVSLQNLGEM